jgi:proline iminopeptidase
MPEADVNGTPLYYERVGSGVPCIALHGGLGMDHTYLKRAFGPLEDVLELIYVDQRGNGRSARPPVETITMQQLADDVRGFADALGLDRFALLGHSFGGFVALEFATTHPERLTHLVLLDTSPGGFEPTPEELAERPDPSTVTREAREAFGRMFSTVPASDEEFAALLPAIAPAYLHNVEASALVDGYADAILDAKTMIRGFEVLPSWSVADELDRIGCPTLVTCGRYDLLTTPECAKRLATRIAQAELAWFENSGHFPWIEEPDAFFGAVRDFLVRNA